MIDTCRNPHERVYRGCTDVCRYFALCNSGNKRIEAMLDALEETK